jgi:cytochrome c oxidase assembly protein subunit 15
VSLWLFACAAFVAAMVVVGGITRLTHSGLSMAQWRPLVGAVPPLSAADWEVLFDRYRETPEYRLVNGGMTLDGFRAIFWWEYAHRLLGRAVGVAFLAPLVWFTARRAISRALAVQLGAVFALGALQGALGWYMVASGLVDVPHVSQYRLAAHLGLAFAILAALLWVALDLGRAPAPATPSSARVPWRGATALAALVFVQVLSGALVAGTGAGYLYNTFPLMGHRLVPGGLLWLSPWWTNVFENLLLVQFDHRVIALAVAVSVLALWARCHAADLPRRAQLASHALLVALGLQLALGIATLVLAVPVPLAAAHQAGAIVLFTAAVWLAHDLRGLAKPNTDHVTA